MVKNVSSKLKFTRKVKSLNIWGEMLLARIKISNMHRFYQWRTAFTGTQQQAFSDRRTECAVEYTDSPQRNVRAKDNKRRQQNPTQTPLNHDCMYA